MGTGGGSAGGAKFPSRALVNRRGGVGARGPGSIGTRAIRARRRTESLRGHADWHHRRRRAHRRRVRPAHRSGADVRERRRGHLGGLRLRLGLRLRRAPLLLRRCGGALRGALRRALRRALRGALRSCHDGTKDEFGSALGAILAVVSFFKYNGALTSSRAPLRRALRGRGGSVARALSRALTHARRSPRARARFTRHLWCPCHWRTPVTLDRKNLARSPTAHGDRKRLSSHRLEARFGNSQRHTRPAGGGREGGD